MSNKIVVSRDVVFEENECWDWERSNEEARLDILEWEDSNEEEVNMIKMKKNLKRMWQQKKKDERLAYLQVSHLERIL